MIKKVFARQIFDSRGNPTVEVDIWSKDNFVRASVPSGASTGVHEALELRDRTKHYMGLGVSKAVKNVNTKIAKKIVGLQPDQKLIDQTLIDFDGTNNKSNLGANAILAVSMAACKLAAKEKNIPLHTHISKISKRKPCLPVPSMNVINGGVHAGNKLDFQEYMIIPVKARSFKEAMMINTEIYHNLKDVIKSKYGKDAINIGDEGGFAPHLNNNKEPFKILQKAIEKAGYTKKVKFAMDAAASEFYKNKKYFFEGRSISPAKLSGVYENLTKDYPLISIEDPFDQDDFDSHSALLKKIKNRCQIVGDDLLVTNPERVRVAVEKKAASALLLKINQIGTITEAIEAANIAFKAGWNVMVSHRSGETTDSFIASLVTGLGTGQIKSGAPCRGERLAKYNELLRIEEQSRLKYKGKIL